MVVAIIVKIQSLYYSDDIIWHNHNMVDTCFDYNSVYQHMLLLLTYVITEHYVHNMISTQQ